MRLYFDVTCLMPKYVSGIGVYARELYEALKNQNLNIHPVTRLSRIFKPSHVHEHINLKVKSFNGFTERLSGKSIVHGPDFRLLSNSNSFFKIVTIHDLAIFHDGFNAEAFRANGQRAINEVLYKGDPHIIITNTQVIADEIRERFPEFGNRVRNIAPGANHFLNDGESIDFINKKSSYFLYAGHLEKRKNIIGIVKAFEIIAQRNKHVRLILVGKDGHQGPEIRKYISESKFSTQIDLLGFVSQARLKELYMSAAAFVFPSFYEGFGFPILEAMSLGCPVITSNFGSMAEIAENSALLVNPNDHSQIAFAMEELLSNSAISEGLIQSGNSQFRKFTWKKSAQAFAELYKNADI